MNLEGEYICGYYVSSKQKRIISVYIDLLAEFRRLCEKNGLTWWIAFGTLLGAVRHRGFIPWDDDVDLFMPRADFDRLQNMTNEQFGTEGAYFLQNTRTDPACVQSLIRFRRGDTTDIRDYDLSYARRHPGQPAYNMGINLAIFPLDTVPSSRLCFSLQSRTAYLLRGICYRATNPDRGKPVQHFVCAAVYRAVGGQRLMRWLHRLYRAPRRIREDLVQNFEGLYPASHLWPKADFDKTIRLPFEDIDVPAPAGCDDILRRTYGDYRQFPPEEQRTGRHDGVTDPDRSYPEVLAALVQSPAAMSR